MFRLIRAPLTVKRIQQLMARVFILWRSIRNDCVISHNIKVRWREMLDGFIDRLSTGVDSNH